MLTTTIFIAVLVGSLLTNFLLEAIILWLGARMAKIEAATIKRALWATVLISAAYLALMVLAWVTTSLLPQLQTVMAFTILAVAFAAPVLIISRVLRTKWWKSLLIWIPTLASTFLVQIALAFPVREHLFEAFTLPSNSMAPTLMGPHWEGVCKECGSRAVSSAYQIIEGEQPSPQLMICVDNFHESMVDNFDTHVHPQDRIIASKYLSPQRWDMIVFRYPEDPATRYVMRLVGLPGEEVVIRDGAVWIDGAKQQLPEHLRGLNYITKIEHFLEPMSGTVEFPAQLAEDEYFVLGDFSSRSKDSRLWYEGAPGHSKYAVPTDHLDGIVTHTYWPPSRWRVFR
ncbi:Signal peptidase I [Symmachiella macrocystis]|uniref:Signal peptidase I n=1 Tax=Symmachiella macrocystis TaxID=2527985 RepID=A0A5C6BBL8_9PLAN|nr:signal peptidase I [Symmachiella macrocystis]TWU09473.1 Signal peptidase I [Symmachiella macrocystis]